MNLFQTLVVLTGIALISARAFALDIWTATVTDMETAEVREFKPASDREILLPTPKTNWTCMVASEITRGEIAARAVVCIPKGKNSKIDTPIIEAIGSCSRPGIPPTIVLLQVTGKGGSYQIFLGCNMQ